MSHQKQKQPRRKEKVRAPTMKVEKVVQRVLKGQGMVESTRGPKRKVVSKPKDVRGSVKQYGTPYNGLNSQLLKFTPSEEQAALLAWMHTVANPRTKVPHPVPIAATPGASAAVPYMYQCTVTGVGHANASGFFAAAICSLSWGQLPVGGGALQNPLPQGPDLVTPGQFKTIGYITDTDYNGTGGGLPLSLPAAGTDLDAYGANEMVELLQPATFAPQVGQNTRYNLVSAEIRCRPLEAALESQGRIAAFNYRATPTPENAPTAADAYSQSMAMTVQSVNRHEMACANWPSDKWISSVIVPNTATAFGQWLPSMVDVRHPGNPLAWIVGSGLPSGAPVEVQITWNMAVYGAISYLTGVSTSSEISVDAGRAGPIVATASRLVGPRLAVDARPGTHSAPTASGLASVVRSEQSGNRMPDVASVVKGVKAAKDVVEAVSGIDIAEEIGEVIAGIAAFL